MRRSWDNWRRYKTRTTQISRFQWTRRHSHSSLLFLAFPAFLPPPPSTPCALFSHRHCALHCATKARHQVLQPLFVWCRWVSQVLHLRCQWDLLQWPIDSCHLWSTYPERFLTNASSLAPVYAVHAAWSLHLDQQLIILRPTVTDGTHDARSIQYDGTRWNPRFLSTHGCSGPTPSSSQSNTNGYAHHALLNGLIAISPVPASTTASAISTESIPSTMHHTAPSHKYRSASKKYITALPSFLCNISYPQRGTFPRSH